MNICYCLLSAPQNCEKESLIGQGFFVGPIRDLFSQLRKRKQIFVLQNAKFSQTNKSPMENVPDLAKISTYRRKNEVLA